MPTTGIELKVSRVRENVTLTELSAQIGLSRQALWATERSAQVDAIRARAYLDGLAAIRAAKDAAEKGTAA
jgi:DNA-binding Xre family transcriptional regulator